MDVFFFSGNKSKQIVYLLNNPFCRREKTKDPVLWEPKSFYSKNALFSCVKINYLSWNSPSPFSSSGSCPDSEVDNHFFVTPGTSPGLQLRRTYIIILDGPARESSAIGYFGIFFLRFLWQRDDFMLECGLLPKVPQPGEDFILSINLANLCLGEHLVFRPYRQLSKQFSMHSVPFLIAENLCSKPGKTFALCEIWCNSTAFFI